MLSHPPKNVPYMSDLREYAIAAYFRIFLLHISRLHGPHILKKCPRFSDMPNWWRVTPSTCNDHLRLVGKCVVDFLLVLIELFSLGVTAEALQAIIGSKS